MATKAQERKSLQEIEKIIDSLGTESYVGKAFEGCIEMAHDNIDNDFWSSWKDMYNNESKVAEKATARLNDKAAEFAGVKQSLEYYKKKLDEIKEEYDGAMADLGEEVVKAENLEKRVSELELENMKLKAKLYDMMVGA